MPGDGTHSTAVKAAAAAWLHHVSASERDMIAVAFGPHCSPETGTSSAVYFGRALFSSAFLSWGLLLQADSYYGDQQ